MRLVAAARVAAALVAVAGIWMLIRGQTSNSVQIELGSEPFPAAVGRTTLLISLTQADGTPVDNAAVEVSGHMNHLGMLPITGRTNRSFNGEYQVPVIWPMMGQWLVDVSAQLPDGRVQDQQFEVVVYAVPPSNSGSRTTYRSVSENTALVSDPSRELLIVIPQGAQAMITAGLVDDVIPAEIHLELDGQNTLIIQNNDIVNHTIGPFFVRPGEVIRQEFTKPAVYQGTCSIRHSAEVSIIVED